MDKITWNTFDKKPENKQGLYLIMRKGYHLLTASYNEFKGYIEHGIEYGTCWAEIERPDIGLVVGEEYELIKDIKKEPDGFEFNECQISKIKKGEKIKIIGINFLTNDVTFSFKGMESRFYLQGIYFATHKMYKV